MASANSVTIKDLYFNSHAIVIGISNYKDPNLKLTNPINDAKAMATVLKEKYGFNNIQLLLDNDATKEKLEGIFKDYIRGDVITNKDRLLVYYSGHGIIREGTNNRGQPSEESFLIPHDATRGVYASYVDMETITNNCGLCNAKHILLILDSCYSGSVFVTPRGGVEKPKKITDEYLKRIISKRTIQAVAATDNAQVALDRGLNSNHGAFTGLLLDILNDDMDPDNDGILTASDVGSYLARNIPRYKIPQNPISGHLPGSDFGEFIFNVFDFSKSQLSGDFDDERRKRYFNEANRRGVLNDEEQTVSRLVSEGNDYFLKGNFDQAIACYERAKDANPEVSIPYFSDAWYKKGFSLYNLKMWNDALKCYEKATELKPNYAKAWNHMGACWFKLKKFHKAIECYNKSLAINENYPDAWMNKSFALEEIGQSQDAKKCLERAEKLQ